MKKKLMVFVMAFVMMVTSTLCVHAASQTFRTTYDVFSVSGELNVDETTADMNMTLTNRPGEYVGIAPSIELVGTAFERGGLSKALYKKTSGDVMYAEASCSGTEFYKAIGQFKCGEDTVANKEVLLLA